MPAARHLTNVPSDQTITTLPLLTLGLPVYVSAWLRDAGMPVAPLDPTGIRRGIALPPTERSILLFDSRSASARTDAEAAEALGYETIDAARLLTLRLPGEDPERTVLRSTDPRRRFFESLRPAVESAGGLWIRLADFPHPYRWALCEDALDNDGGVDCDAALAATLSAFADLSDMARPPGRLAAADWLKACALAGRPVRTNKDTNAVLHRHGLNPQGSSLAWVTTIAEFASWWRFRQQLVIRSVRRDRECEIELTMPAGAAATATPALEIWRGRHVAVVPLTPGRIVFRDDALPFQMNAARHSAGFTADATETEFTESLERSAVVAPV